MALIELWIFQKVISNDNFAIFVAQTFNLKRILRVKITQNQNIIDTVGTTYIAALKQSEKLYRTDVTTKISNIYIIRFCDII